MHNLRHLTNRNALIAQNGALERLPDQCLRHELIYLEANGVQPLNRKLWQHQSQQRDYYNDQDEVQVSCSLVSALDDVSEDKVEKHCDADLEQDLGVIG